MNIRPTLYVGLICLACSGSALAGDITASTPEQRAELQTRFMKDKLALTDAATLAKLQAINLKYAQQMEPVLKGDDSRLTRMSKARSIMSAKDVELKQILSPAQFETYDDTKDDLKTYMESHL